MKLGFVFNIDFSIVSAAVFAFCEIHLRKNIKLRDSGKNRWNKTVENCFTSPRVKWIREYETNRYVNAENEQLKTISLPNQFHGTFVCNVLALGARKSSFVTIRLEITAARTESG